MMKHTLLAAAMIAGMALPAAAASLSKTYSYFSIGGNTLDEIESQLASRGPHVSTSNRRHPGATQMEFTTRLSYSQKPGSCKIVSAHVLVKAKLILPKWQRSRKAEQDVRLIWDTLAADIKRHEESHVVIAKNHAREMEQALKAMRAQPDCAIAAAKAKDVTAKILARHDRAQMEFDRVEGKNFESRIMRLLNYRLEQIKAGRLPG